MSLKAMKRYLTHNKRNINQSYNEIPFSLIRYAKPAYGRQFGNIDQNFKRTFL